MKPEQLLKIVNHEFQNSMGAENQEISVERAAAMDRYLGKPLGNEVEGQSDVVTSDVADVVDGLMPSLLRIFTTAENVVGFDPTGPEDIKQAEQESDYVSHVFFKENPSFLIMFYWMFDALLQKNGIVMANWDESEEVTTENYKALSDVELADLLEDDELEPVAQLEREDESGTVYDVDFRRVRKTGRVCVENVPPNEFRISKDCASLDPNKARMVGWERDMTRSDLKGMGFDPVQIDELPSIAPSADGVEKRARKDKGDEQDADASMDKSQELVRVRMAFIKVDFDDDGRAERRLVYTSVGGSGDSQAQNSSKGHLLRWKDGSDANQPVDRQPFHVLCAAPLPHKHFGRSPAEKVIDVQETSTTLLRQVLDNLHHTNNPQHAVWEAGMSENTLDDLLSTRVGSIKRFARSPQESYMPLTVPFTAGSTFPMLEYFDTVKRDRTGISNDSQGLTPDALKHIQTSAAMQFLDKSREKIEAVARIFAETGIRSLFLHIHELLLKHQDKEKVVQLRNEFVPIKPSSWRTRYNMTVKVGLGIGSREQNLLHLNSIREFQTAIVQAGGMNLLVSPKNIWHTASEYVKNANLHDPRLYFTDPGDQKAPPPADEMVQLQKQQQEIEQRRQELDAQRQANAQQKIDIEKQSMELRHREQMAELKEKQEAREDKFFVELENLRNDLTEMRLKYGNEGVQ